MQYMTHEKHGRMPVYSPTEIEVNQKNGWLLEGAVEAKDLIKTKDFSELYFDKFGKKPHHKMKDETIKKAIEGE